MNMFVADSSFDTWLVGYVMGIPNRKVSIYTEGVLCALMLDNYFLKKSNGQVSLRDLMTRLYRDYACKGKGLSEEDYIHDLISYGADKALEIVENYIYGTKDFRISLDEALSLVGLQIVEEENKEVFASCLGLKTLRKQTEFHIKQVLLDSVADKSRIAEGDIILSIDGEVISKELLDKLIEKDSAVFKLKRHFETIDIELSLKIKSHYPLYKIVPMETISEQQKSLFEKWSGA